MTSVRSLLATTFLLSAVAFAAKPTVLNWPNDDKPVIRFTIPKFDQVGGTQDEKIYQSKVEAVNLWTKTFSGSFELFAYDAKHVRVGQGYITLSDVSAGQTVRFVLTMQSIGQPATLELHATQLPAELRPLEPPRKVNIQVFSIPSGADVKVDGTAAGTTPVQVALLPGKHQLEFSKPGFSTGTYPLLLGPNDTSGATVTYELGSASRDTIELRDGTLITGDLVSVDAQQVVVRIGGEAKAFDRNQVKRILLIEREPSPAPK